MICFLMPLFYINYYHRVMFKKQVSWTDAGQKFVHPIRKGDIFKKTTINAKCLMHAAALTGNIDSHCSKKIQKTCTHIFLHSTSAHFLLVSFITAQNSNEIKQVILKI